MDGSPLARLVIVLIFLGLLGLPVIALTREKPSAPVAAPSPEAASAREQKVDLVVTLSHPGRVEIRQANQVVAVSDALVSVLEKEITLPDTRAELTVTFHWADGVSPHAGRVVVSQDGETWADQTFWGDAEAQDVLSVQGPKQP